MAVRADGKVFRNRRGKPWTKYALCNRIYRRSRVAGVKKTAYDMRHGFATRKLVQGRDHLTIVELMGHRAGTMLAKVYAHLDRNDAHLKRALED
jgi:integrase